MDNGKSLLTVPSQTDVNRLQGIKLLSAEVRLIVIIIDIEFTI
jgi:hypothetical protein